MIKIYSTFDFDAVNKRMEKTKIDPYSVHVEDFENINDLIERSVRTKTSIKKIVNEEKIPGSVYDTEEQIAEFFGNDEPKQEQTAEAADQAKQSDGQAAAETAQDLQAKS